MSEFLDCHATLVEFEAHRENLLGSIYNTVSIGMAFNNKNVVVVDIFTQRHVVVNKCEIDDESFTIYVEGKCLNDKYGVFAMRIVCEDNIERTALSINPQEINYIKESRIFYGIFKNANKVIEELIKQEKRYFLQIYLRDHPETIKYLQQHTDKMRFNELILGYRCYLENFPHPYYKIEMDQIELEEAEFLKKEKEKKAEQEVLEREERNRRENKNLPDSKKGGLGDIEEEPDEELSKDSESDLGSKMDKESDKISMESLASKPSIDDQQEPSDNQLNKLELNIESLKRDNEELQKKIAIIYEFKKQENKEDRNYYKESNINDSTYHDTLTTAANLYNELSTHKKKLNADLLKYEQSIKIQEERKKDVYKILMNYKEELINNAEDRKGAKIPQRTIENWLATERRYEEEIRNLRIENIKNTLLLSRHNKELKKMEEYFEGLHYIDFEQLKIENNVLLFTFRLSLRK